MNQSDRADQVADARALEVLSTMLFTKFGPAQPMLAFRLRDKVSATRHLTSRFSRLMVPVWLSAILGITLFIGPSIDGYAILTSPTGHIRSQLQLSRTLRLMVDEETGLRGYTSTGESLFLEPYDGAERLLPNRLKELGAAVLQLHDTRALNLVASIRATHTRWIDKVAVPLIHKTRLKNHLRLFHELSNRYVTALITSFDSMHRAYGAGANRPANSMPEFDSQSRLLGVFITEETAALEYATTGDPLADVAYDAARRQLDARLSRMRDAAGVRNDRQTLEFVDALRVLHRHWLSEVALPLIHGGGLNSEIYLHRLGKHDIDAIRTDFAALQTIANGILNVREQRLRAVVRAIALSLACGLWAAGAIFVRLLRAARLGRERQLRALSRLQADAQRRIDLLEAERERTAAFQAAVLPPPVAASQRLPVRRGLRTGLRFRARRR